MCVVRDHSIFALLLRNVAWSFAYVVRCLQVSAGLHQHADAAGVTEEARIVQRRLLAFILSRHICTGIQERVGALYLASIACCVQRRVLPIPEKRRARPLRLLRAFLPQCHAASPEGEHLHSSGSEPITCEHLWSRSPI